MIKKDIPEYREKPEMKKANDRSILNTPEWNLQELLIYRPPITLPEVDKLPLNDITSSS